MCQNITHPLLGGYSVNSCYYSFFNNGFVKDGAQTDDSFEMEDDATHPPLITSADLLDQNSLYPSSCQVTFIT